MKAVGTMMQRYLWNKSNPKFGTSLRIRSRKSKKKGRISWKQVLPSPVWEEYRELFYTALKQDGTFRRLVSASARIHADRHSADPSCGVQHDHNQVRPETLDSYAFQLNFMAFSCYSIAEKFSINNCYMPFICDSLRTPNFLVHVSVEANADVSFEGECQLDI